MKNPATLVESSVAGFLSSLKQDKGGQKELVKSASKPCDTRFFSAYIFLETVGLEENVMKHAVFLNKELFMKCGKTVPLTFFPRSLLFAVAEICLSRKSGKDTGSSC